MDYVGSIYRPPSEAYSMLLQVTTGCSHNKCSFCGMYLEKPFGLKPYETVKNDILTAARQGPAHKRAFLCDGDALIMPQKRLVQVSFSLYLLLKGLLKKPTPENYYWLRLNIQMKQKFRHGQLIL